MTPIEQFYFELRRWEKLGWIPYCPKGVRNVLKRVPFWMPYSLQSFVAKRSYKRYEKRKEAGRVN